MARFYSSIFFFFILLSLVHTISSQSQLLVHKVSFENEVYAVTYACSRRLSFYLNLMKKKSCENITADLLQTNAWLGHCTRYYTGHCRFSGVGYSFVVYAENENEGGNWVVGREVL